MNFIDKHRERGARYVDWQARFRGWIRKSRIFPANGASSKTHRSASESESSSIAIARKCTHGKCPPEVCLLSREGFEAQDVEKVGAVAARVMNRVSDAN